MNVLGQALKVLFVGMIIAGAVISFSGWMVDSDPDRGSLLAGEPGFGNELSFLLVLFGAIGLFGTLTLRNLPFPWDK